MAKNKVIASLELGSSKICTLIAQVQAEQTGESKSVNIAGASSVLSRGIKKGQIVNLEEAVESAISSIEAAERMAGYNLDRVYVSLGGASISSQNSHGVVAVSDPEGEITADDVDRVIEAASAISLPQSREVVHVIPREFTVDGETGVKDPLGMSGVRLEVETHIVTASSASIKNLKKALNEVGVGVDGIVFTGIAAAEAVVTPTEKELGSVLVDIGGGTTSISVFTDGAVSYSGVIPIGANNVTNDLAIGLRVSLETAEKIKTLLSKPVHAGLAKKPQSEDDEIELAKMGISEIRKVSRKTLTEGIIRPRLNEIFTMVRLDLEKVGLGARVPSGVVITGGGAETVGILESAKRTLSLPVRLGIPGGVGGLVDDILNPAFSVPIGLILYGVKRESFEPFTSFSKRVKFSPKGILGKVIESIKDLLP